MEARNDRKLIRKAKGQLKKSIVHKAKNNKIKFINCVVTESIYPKLLVHQHYGNDNIVNNTVGKTTVFNKHFYASANASDGTL